MAPIKRRAVAVSARGPSRRLYDPKAEPVPKRASVDGDPARAAAKDLKGGWDPDKPGAKRRPRRVKDLAKEALKERAHALAKDKGVPLVHAYRILKGEVTLNDVLKSMMRRERFEQLVRREGIDRELAGQVVSGHLSRARAKILTRMRELRGHKLNVDAISRVEGRRERIAVDLFGQGWVTGWVKEARSYEFDFIVDGTEAETRMFYKHDVKAVCLVDELDAVKRAVTADETVASQELGGTASREERIRPDDEWMIGLVDARRVVRFTMRDGEAFLGVLRSFGRWDAELVLPGGETVTLFFHGLHPASQTLGLSE